MLYIDSGIAVLPGMERLLDRVNTLIQRDTSGLRQRPGGNYEMHAPMPHGYKPRMMPWATTLSAGLSGGGWLFSISEVSEDGFSSGGWIGSCIPPSMYATFLNAWLDSRMPQQKELFA